MSWQDVVLTGTNVVFLLSMIAAVRDTQKPPLTTSVPATVALTVVCFVQINLELYLTTVITFAVAVLWGTVAIQRYRQGKILLVKKSSK